MANKSPGSIFNFGDTLSRLFDTGLSAVETVAPVWLADQLNLNQQIPVAVNPTYQNTDPQRQPASGLTTNETEAVRGESQIVFKQSTILLVGAIALGGLLFLRDRG